MTNTKVNRRASVDSLYVSRSYGDQVRVRTYLGHRDDSYVISVNGRRVLETRSKAVVRDYLTRNDCHAVASFKE